MTEKPKKHSGGRPTKFDPKYTEDLIKFFDVEPYRQVISESSRETYKDGGIKKESVKYRLVPNKLPTLYQFSRKIKVSYSTVWRWANKGEDEGVEKLIDTQIRSGKTDIEAIEIAKGIKEFCNAYKEAKELQKEFLMNNGLIGASPAPAYIFTAKNITDMRDKVEQDVTHNLPVPLLHVLHNNSNQENKGAEEAN